MTGCHLTAICRFLVRSPSSQRAPCAKKITQKNASSPAVAEHFAAEHLAVHKLAMACLVSCLSVQRCTISDAESCNQLFC